MKRIISLLLPMSLFLAVACNNQNNPAQAELESIYLNKRSVSIEVGESLRLLVIYEPEEAAETADPVRWESSDEKVASVTNAGVVDGLKPGSATITAYCGSLRASCEVEVEKPADPVPVQSIALSETSKSLFVGEKFSLTVTYNPEESERTADEILWSTSDESVATVSNGLVEAVGAGTATITAKCGTHTATCKVTATVYTTEIVLNPSELTFSVAGGVQKVSVLSVTPWTAAYEADWFSLSAASGEGNAEITVTVKDGEGSDVALTGTVTFQNAEESATLTVTRKAKEYVFSVSETKKVKFAPGNLQYQKSTNKWRFAPKQYEHLGKGPNIATTAWQDLFYWGATGAASTFDPRETSSSVILDHTPYVSFFGGSTDWGASAPIGDDPARTWRSLSESEMEYVISKRVDHQYLYFFAKVGEQWGLVLMPDGWNNPTDIVVGGMAPAKNNFTVDYWVEYFESQGAVFFPCSSNKGDYTYYWTGSARTNVSQTKHYSVAMYMYVDDYGYIHDPQLKTSLNIENLTLGLVRLVQVVE